MQLEEFRKDIENAKAENKDAWYLVGCAEAIIERMEREIKYLENKNNRLTTIAANIAEESQILERLPKEEVLTTLNITDDEFYTVLC